MGDQRSEQTNSHESSRQQSATPASKPPLVSQGHAHPLLQLQRQLGNRAVTHLIQTNLIQAKLSVSQPNDRYEQEADRTADTVMRMPDSIVQRQPSEAAAIQAAPIERITPLMQRQAEEEKEPVQMLQRQAEEEKEPVQMLQRQAEEEKEPVQMLQRQAEEEKEPVQMLQRQEEEKEPIQAKATHTPDVSSGLETQIQSMRGGGQPLPASTRDFFEPRFGYDFSSVRVHTDSQANDAARQLNAQAFTLRQDVFFGAGYYQPDTFQGRSLLAHELTHTVQQNPTTPLAAKREIMQPQSEGGHTPPPSRGQKNSAIGLSSKFSPTIQRKVGGGKAPASSAHDPAFQAVVKKAKAAAKKQKQHDPAKAKAAAAQSAAAPPANDVGSKAAGKQVGQMDQQQPKPFDRKAFKTALLDKIAASAPKNLEEADKFKESGKVGAIKGELTGQVDSSKKQSGGAIESKVKGTPDPSGIPPKAVTPLPPNLTGAPPTGIGAAQATPKPKTAAETSLQEGSQSLDKQMADAEVTEGQLKNSNEPDFQAAVGAKQQAQKDAVTAPQAYRKNEQAVLTQAQSQAATTAKAQLMGMHGVKGQAQNKTTTAQQQAKAQDEQKRVEVANELQTIYTQTKKAAEDRLAHLDTEVNQAFDQGATASQKAFEDYVQRRMDAYKDDRYSGLLGGGRWLKDKFLGLPSKVNEFYQEGRQLYIAKMDAVLDRVAILVEKGLNEAKAEIAKGRKAIEKKLGEQKPSLQKALQEDAQKIQGQFDQLEQSVDDKQNQLIDSLAQKYNEKLQAIDARIDEMKAANRGLVDKAIDAVGGVIKAILQLKDLLLNILAKVASAIKKIIKDPIGFLGNLVSGVKQGFMNFIGNIGSHLQKGLMGWLFGAIAEAGIQLPDSFDVKGILSLILQVLGATWTFIRARAVKILGEKVVKAMETGAEIFQILITKGITGVWDYIKEQVSHLKDVVIDGIQSFVTDNIIKAGVTWIIGLLNPAGAFIKACKAIYDIVMFFVERGSQIIALVNAVVDSVGAIADGNIGVAAKFVENALGNAVPVVIGFLASLLGVTGISKKIQEIIKKVQEPVGKAIDWLISKAYNLVKAAGKLLGFGKDKKDEKADPEHDKKVQEGLIAIDQEEEKHLKAGKISREDAEEVAKSVKSKHPIFKSFTVISSEKHWKYHYVASKGDHTGKGERTEEGEGNKIVVRAFHGAAGDSILSIINSQQMKPEDGKIFLAKGSHGPGYMHGADSKRKASFVIEVELTFDADKVKQQSRSTPGVLNTQLLETKDPVAAQVLKLFIRTRDEEGFQFDERIGADKIKAYLENADLPKAISEAPKLRAPDDRHFAGGLSIPKKSGNSLFTIDAAQVKADVSEINNGQARRSGNEFTTSSGRIYSFHDDILYPVKGPGIIQLSSAQYNLLLMFKKTPDKGELTSAKLLEKGIFSSEEVSQVKQLARQFGFISG